MMDLYIIRHGETEWNINERMQGVKDSPLTVRGLGQAEDLARRLSSVKIDKIYSSDLGRARKTAEKIAELQDTKIILRKELRERSFGNLEGKSILDIKEENSSIYEMKTDDDFNFRAPEGESLKDIKPRLEKFLAEILEKDKQKKVVLVTHNGTKRVIVGSLLGWDNKKAGNYKFSNTALTHLVLTQTGPKLRILNCTQHIKCKE